MTLLRDDAPVVIDLTAERAPIMVKRQPNGGVTIEQGESLILMDDAELTEFIRMAQPTVMPATVQQRLQARVNDDNQDQRPFF